MTVTCPDGHASTADDYCDVCGAPITGTPAGTPDASDAGAGPSSAGSAQPTGGAGVATELTCPNCSVPNLAEALFCEACGYDFTTGTMPRTAEAGESGSGLFDDTVDGAAAVPGEAGDDQAAGTEAADDAPFDWVAEVWIDPDWYAAQQSPDPLPSAGPPEIVPLRGSSILIGRTSRSLNIHPDLPCESDTGVSRRQAQLTTDGVRWWVEDLDSSNGTFVGSASGPLPEQPIPVGPRHELDSDDRIYLGAWTRIVIREATDDEK